MNVFKKKLMDVMKTLCVQTPWAHLHVTSAKRDFHVMKTNVHVSIKGIPSSFPCRITSSMHAGCCEIRFSETDKT